MLLLSTTPTQFRRMQIIPVCFSRFELFSPISGDVTLSDLESLQKILGLIFNAQNNSFIWNSRSKFDLDFFLS